MPRLSKIYTRTGDTGETGLVGNQRVSKDAPRIWAYGTVDELNAAVGLARALNSQAPAPARDRVEAELAAIQNNLFDLGAELATPPELLAEGMPRVTQAHIDRLEELMDELNLQLGPLKEFILPGGAPAAAALHQARTVCRRAERFCVRLAGTEKVGGLVLPYLNRLSDALFVLARWANHQAGHREIEWQK